MGRSAFSGDSANLDLIRAVAVLCVFIAHFRTRFLGDITEWDWRYAQLGVLIFFVHTCFVLMLSMERARYGGAAFVWSFYVRRFFRLYPLSIFFVLAVYLFGGAHWSIPQLVANLALTFDLSYTQPMWGVMWTLAVEMQMYIVLPAIFLFCRGRAFRWAIGLWLLALPLAYLQPHVSGRLDMLTYAPCFLGGVIAWRLSKNVMRRSPSWLWPLAFAATTLVWLSTSRADQGPHRWLFGLALGLAIPFFREITFRPVVRVAQVVAKYSYGIYLSHPAAIVISVGLPLSLLERWLVFWFIAIAAPIALYHLIEKPMIDVGQRLTRRLFESQTPPALASARS